MISAGILPDANRSNRHAFHRAGDCANGDQIAGIHAVLELDKNAVDDVFDQRL